MRRVKEGTSAVLLQSGLDEKWWVDSIECHCYLRNVKDQLSDGKTPYKRRFGIQFNGPVIPFGAMVEYHPISAKDLSRVHQFGKKVLPGILLGYALRYMRRESGKETFWSQTLRNWKRWTHQTEGEEQDNLRGESDGLSLLQTFFRKLHFPSRRWNSQNFRRRSGSENIHFNPGSPRPRRRTRISSRRIRRVFFNTISRVIVV